jgi:glycerophosphoryl diester phosphodiesterase
MLRMRTIGALSAGMLAGLAVTSSLIANAAPAGATVVPVTCIAHRGNPTTHTEATMPTYNATLAAGLLHVDGDVRWSSTGYPYMLHNADMGLFGHPTVDLIDISGTTAVSYLSGSGDHIASLYEVRTAILANPGSTLEMELKTVPTSAQWTTLGTRIDDIRSRVTVTSFNLATVRAAQDRGYRTAFLTSTVTTSTASGVIDQDFSTITAQSVSDLADVGVSTEAWTPNTSADWTALAGKGVTVMNTDDAAGCVTWNAARMTAKRKR